MTKQIFKNDIFAETCMSSNRKKQGKETQPEIVYAPIDLV